ncbi:unnamed protein product [Paramecium primaurelia]|uniref:Uncharacterized protein n=1 Tax=Paramecium primaurelia TaxID=5886 RepID=A0A8S1P5M7_PARPR|nr:unnamed protein product [Paramecium primaurelia]
MLLTYGYCPNNFKLCELSQICYPTFYKFRDDQCQLALLHIKINGSYCQGYQDETPRKNTIFLDSKYLIQEYQSYYQYILQFQQHALISNKGQLLQKVLISYILSIPYGLTQFLGANYFGLNQVFQGALHYSTTPQYYNRICIYY